MIGKSSEMQYGYQEIEEPFSISQTNNMEEVKNLEFDQLSDDAVEEICRNFKVTIHIKEPESYINCVKPLIDRSRSVILMKRDAEAFEGSGDSGDPETTEAPLTTNNPETTEIAQEKSENLPQSEVEAPPENESKAEEPMLVSSEVPDSNPTEKPGSFQGGFDNILKSNPNRQNNSLEDLKNTPTILKNSQQNDQINTKTEEGEEARTGESKEKPTAASPNNMLLIVIGALGVIGALAFVYNFVRSRRENREIDEVVKLEMEGKELKEMKPLMKSPLAQNGAKSLEYIDADPQIHVPSETRVEVTRES